MAIWTISQNVQDFADEDINFCTFELATRELYIEP